MELSVSTPLTCYDGKYRSSLPRTTTNVLGTISMTVMVDGLKDSHKAAESP